MNMRLAVERRVRNCNGRSLYDGTSAEVGGAAACCGAHDGPDFCFSSGLWVWPAAESGLSGWRCVSGVRKMAGYLAIILAFGDGKWKIAGKYLSRQKRAGTLLPDHEAAD